MASNSRSSGTAAFRYASALVELAMESGAIPQIQKDVSDLQSMIAGSEDLKSVIRSPLIGAEAQKSALSALSDKAGFAPLTRNFLLVLCDNRRLRDVEAILKAVQDTLAAGRGELRAKVESALELSAAQKKDLEDSLSQTVGQPVIVESAVNETLIGGVVVTLGSLMIDDSIKTKLDRLSRAMKYKGAEAA